MRHRLAGRHFGRDTNQRKALFRTLIASLFQHLRIETTVAKAKEVKKIAEPLITFGKRGDLHARRLVLSRLPNKAVVGKLFHEIAPALSERSSGYLRVVKTRRRAGDAAQMAILEFVDYEKLKKEHDGKISKAEQTK
jgi:large subunit ribosomal protein L17